MMIRRHPIHEPPRGWLFAGVLALLGPLSLHGANAETPELVKAVLENAPVAAAARCAYTRVKEDPDGTKTERYDPLGAPPWSLVSIDGRPPTPEELQRYAGKAQGRTDRRHPLAFDLRDLVSRDGWTLRSRTGDEAVFEFRLRPTEELDERLVDKVRGTLVVDVERLQPVRASIENTEPAYVAPFVRIASYTQSLRFDWSEAIGSAVLVETETHRRGRALAVKSLRKDKTVHYRDYTCLPEPPVAAGS